MLYRRGIPIQRGIGMGPRRPWNGSQAILGAAVWEDRPTIYRSQMGRWSRAVARQRFSASRLCPRELSTSAVSDRRSLRAARVTGPGFQDPRRLATRLYTRWSNVYDVIAITRRHVGDIGLLHVNKDHRPHGSPLFTETAHHYGKK